MNLGQHVYWVAPLIAGSIAAAYYIGYNQGQKDLSLKETALVQCKERYDYVAVLKEMKFDDTLRAVQAISENIKGAKDLIARNEAAERALRTEREVQSEVQDRLAACDKERQGLTDALADLRSDMEEAKTLLFDKIERNEEFLLHANQTYDVTGTGILIGLLDVNADNVLLSINGAKENLGPGTVKPIRSALFECKLHIQQFWVAKAEASFKIACSTKPSP